MPSLLGPWDRFEQWAGNSLCRQKFLGCVSALVACSVGALSGCGGANSQPHAGGGKALPAEYRVVATSLGHPLKPDARDFRNDKSMAEAIADVQSLAMDLRKVKSSDADLTQIAAQGEAACAEVVRRMERINALPKPPNADSLFVESFLHGFFGDVAGGFALGADADYKQKALLAEFEGLAAALDKADAAHLLLPKVAEAYAAPVQENSGRILVDFDESWYGWGPNDWCRLCNTGAELEDCTVVVEMRGRNGQTRRNVHFVNKWHAGTWLYGRYEPGLDLNGRRVGNMTVTNVETVEVTVLSPAFSTRVHYTYPGVERDRDITARCENLKLRWRYQPFDKGVVFSDTQRGVKLTLTDSRMLGPCRVTITFKQGSDAKSWYWDLKSWNNDEEKSFSTPPGGLTWDPETVEVVLTFPGSAHQSRWNLKVIP